MKPAIPAWFPRTDKATVWLGPMLGCAHCPGNAHSGSRHGLDVLGKWLGLQADAVEGVTPAPGPYLTLFQLQVGPGQDLGAQSLPPWAGTVCHAGGQVAFSEGPEWTLLTSLSLCCICLTLPFLSDPSET